MTFPAPTPERYREQKTSLLKGNNLKRILSGVVLIPLVVGMVLYGSPALFFGMVLVVIAVGWYEYTNIIRNIGIEIYFATGAVSSLALAACFFTNDYYLIWMATTVTALFIAWYVTSGEVDEALDPMAYTLMGVIYVAGLMSYCLLVRDQPGGSQYILFLFIVIWLGDITAYYVGKTVGKTQLAPKISPGKTIEGSVGGLIGSVLGGAIAYQGFLEGITLTHCLIMALFCGIIGQLGDLAESLLKRSAGVKDSGSLIPGHGGVLDRLDSLMFAGPAFYCYQTLFL